MANLNYNAAEVANKLFKQMTGESDVEQVDYEKVADSGRAQLQSNKTEFVSGVIGNVIAQTIFEARLSNKEENEMPFLRSSFEYGSITRKITFDIGDVEDDPSMQELADAQECNSYPFYKPKLKVKYFEHLESFMKGYSVKWNGLESAFNSGTELSAYMDAMIQAAWASVITKEKALEEGARNKLILTIFAQEYPENDYTTKSTERAVNLLYLYNQKNPSAKLTVENCLTNPDFVKFENKILFERKNQMTKMNAVFGEGIRNSNEEDIVVIRLDQDYYASKFYLEADTYHKDLVSFDKGNLISYWQGSGKGQTSFDFDKCSKIHGLIDNAKEVNVGGVLTLMADKKALAMCNLKTETRPERPNARYGFQNFYIGCSMGVYMDADEQACVFFIA